MNQTLQHSSCNFQNIVVLIHRIPGLVHLLVFGNLHNILFPVISWSRLGRCHLFMSRPFQFRQRIFHHFIIFPHGNRLVAPLTVDFIIGTAKEALALIFWSFHHQITILAIGALHNRKFFSAKIAGHKTADFRFVGADIQAQSIGRLIFQLKRKSTDWTFIFAGYLRLFFRPFPPQKDIFILPFDFQ